MSQSSPPDKHYHYQFDENGGYDCMYGAFDIISPSGERVAEVDLRHHGQKPCQHPIPVAAIESASRLAGIIVDALNATLSSTAASISPDLRDVLREYDGITSKADLRDPEWDFVMRAADYRLIRECLAKLPVEIVNPPKGWTP
jgi:hypothetical protein